MKIRQKLTMTMAMIALFIMTNARGQSVYYDTVNGGIRSTYGRLCANIVPIALGYFDTTVQLTRLSVTINGFPMANVQGTWYLDYQIGTQWYSIAQDNFTFPIDQTVTFLAARVGLFVGLQETIMYNGRRLVVVFQ